MIIDQDWINETFKNNIAVLFLWKEENLTNYLSDGFLVTWYNFISCFNQCSVFTQLHNVTVTDREIDRLRKEERSKGQYVLWYLIISLLFS